MLRAAFPDLLQWDWLLPNPYKWNVWMSMDGGNTYILIEDYWGYGDARQFAPDGGGELYYIVGIDDTGREITKHSNIVRPDDAPSPPSLHDSLMAYWNLDESEDMVRNDSTNQGFDLSEWSFQEATGSDHVPVGQNNGIRGYAADFGDGSGGKGLVSWAANTILDGDFSFSCWINFNSESGYDGQGLISVGGTVQIGIRAYDHALNFVIPTDGDGSPSWTQTANDSISEYTWTHAVFVKDGDTLRIYLNGVESANAPFDGSVVPSAAGYFTATDLILGINPWGYPLIGLLDEVGCWQRALSAYDVGLLYNYGSGLPYEWF